MTEQVTIDKITFWNKKRAFFIGSLFGMAVDWAIADQIARQSPILFTRYLGNFYLDIMGTIEFLVFGIVALIFYQRKEKITRNEMNI